MKFRTVCIVVGILGWVAWGIYHFVLCDDGRATEVTYTGGGWTDGRTVHIVDLRIEKETTRTWKETALLWKEIAERRVGTHIQGPVTIRAENCNEIGKISVDMSGYEREEGEECFGVKIIDECNNFAEWCDQYIKWQHPGCPCQDEPHGRYVSSIAVK